MPRAPTETELRELAHKPCPRKTCITEGPCQSCVKRYNDLQKQVAKMQEWNNAFAA